MDYRLDSPISVGLYPFRCSSCSISSSSKSQFQSGNELGSLIAGSLIGTAGEAGVGVLVGDVGGKCGNGEGGGLISGASTTMGGGAFG